MLPVHALRTGFVDALARGPVVLSSPTGSGKSTEVPRWCAGPVLVVEPRRIACRSLAARVAELEATRLGEGVGYIVRDEHVASAATRIVFVTPGMVLRNRALLATARTVILDEFHERSLDTDLLLALLLQKAEHALVIMSATLEGERVAAHVSGTHLSVEGRAFPVALHYLPGRASLPDPSELPARVAQALAQAANDPGDVLVFLPGKAEIEACTQALRGAYSVIPLHGGLSLDEQRRAFDATPRRKVILATNVAETSLTIPGIGVVIDAGLVRQTRYQAGRGFLALTPIAEDSAAQRAGRAGRTAPGVCYRLWSPGAKLAASTLPEIHRESLVPLVLTAAAWGQQVEALPLLDPPKPYALEAARADLAAWGALAGDAALSESGRGLFALPLEPLHARLLIAARAEGCLEDMIDLVSVLSVGRPLFLPGQQELGLTEDLRLQACDASAAVAALRADQPADHGASSFVVREARATRKRLRRAEGLPDSVPVPRPLEREALVRAAIRADARLVHVARPRGRELFFSNGGTELELARESAVHHARGLEAIVVLDSRALGAGRDSRVLVTCAMAVPLSVLARAGLGQDRLAAVRLDGKRVVASIERVFANRVIAEREETPEGELARAAIHELLVRGSLFRRAVEDTRERLARAALSAWLAARGHPAGVRLDDAELSLADWLRKRVESLGVSSGDDLALLSADDFLAPELPYESRSAVDSDYPLSVSVGDASYRAEYQLELDQVTLRWLKGQRSEPPPLAYLPKFPGLRICVESRSGVTVLRPRG
ncbi:MAG: ATP-dependent helicase [Myxococcaceae bacterium]|nr:ATP-dependent helicase [Myxococcaceae bacterium]